MNKIHSMLTILLLTALFNTLQAQTTSRTATVSFGRYGEECTSGRGACAFNVQNNAANASSTKSSQKIDENSLLLKISRNVLSREDEVKIAGKRFSEFAANETPTFLQQDQLILDNTTLQNLGISTTHSTIAIGTYPMTIYNDRIEVKFTLSAN